MADAFANKIKRLELENFTCFGKVAMEFSPGINVFIGENGTGKTHLLKVLYMSTNKDFVNKFPDGKYVLSPTITSAFVKNYYPSSVKAVNLIKQETPAKNSGVVSFDAFNRHFGLRIDSVQNGYNDSFQMDEHRGIFIPQQELLSWYKGFIPAYLNRESDVDPTYFFLASSLGLRRLKGIRLEQAMQLASEIEEALGVEVQLEGDEFYIYYKDKGGIKAALEATGINKLAQILQLILNGSLHKDTILFWDEPESNLNPKYIVVVAKFLQRLANAGCQIFVATHDYLLPYHLSLSVEYADEVKKMKEKVPDMKFFALYKGENGTEAEEGKTMPSIQHDAILEGHGIHHDWENELFRKSLNPQS